MNTSSGESRLVLRLEEAIRAERDPVRKGCLRGEWAGMQARQGQLDCARDEVAALRREFDAHQHVEVGVWVFVAESFIAHYSSLGNAARDRMKRALAFSTSAGLMRLRALSAASMAHFEYSRDEPEELVKYLQMALSGADHADQGTLSRAHLVGAMAYHFGGRFDLAQPWYIKARQHAIGGGDDVALAGLVRIMSALRSLHAKNASLFDLPSEEDARHALAIANSGQNLDLVVGSGAFDSMPPFVKASVAAVQGRYADAIELYSSALPKLPDQGLNDMTAHALADMAWCCIGLGRVDEASTLSERALQAHSNSDHGEDQLAVYGRLSQVFKSLNDARHAEFAALAINQLEAHRALQRRFVAAMNATALQLS